jgi:hypothetical protein
MYRGKVMVTTAAIFAIGAAFAAQPTSTRADRLNGELRRPTLWTPGTNGVMAAYETSAFPLAPPR